jgi:hypothetical protein
MNNTLSTVVIEVPRTYAQPMQQLCGDLTNVPKCRPDFMRALSLCHNILLNNMLLLLLLLLLLLQA